MDDDLDDPDFCLRKAQEYRDKAKVADDLTLKENLEAIARELVVRANELKSRRGA
jgi:hypothetical protein